MTVNADSSTIRKGDAVPILAGEAHSIRNTGATDLELMIIGVATEKGKLETIEVK